MSKAVHAPAAPAQAGPYSHAVRSGNLVFLSGQGPFEPDGSGIPDGFDAQARRTFRNLAVVAEAAGDRSPTSFASGSTCRTWRTSRP
jgi:2-iminobutanoate/2-iminopropanoate deaminase